VREENVQAARQVGSQKFGGRSKRGQEGRGKTSQATWKRTGADGPRQKAKIGKYGKGDGHVLSIVIVKPRIKSRGRHVQGKLIEYAVRKLH